MFRCFYFHRRKAERCQLPQLDDVSIRHHLTFLRLPLGHEFLIGEQPDGYDRCAIMHSRILADDLFSRRSTSWTSGPLEWMDFITLSAVNYPLSLSISPPDLFLFSLVIWYTLHAEINFRELIRYYWGRKASISRNLNFELCREDSRLIFDNSWNWNRLWLLAIHSLFMII